MPELHRMGTVGSTNDELVRLAQRGAVSGTAVAAEHQTAGRGRRGREWLSPVGDHIFVSILWKPPTSLPSSALAGVTLDVGSAIAESLVRWGLDARVKWPNDVWVGERKIAGVLSELHDEGVIVGVGVNVNVAADALPAGILPIATSVASELGHAVDRDRLLSELVDAVRAGNDAYAARGGPDIDGYARRCITLGRRISVEGRGGVADGIAPDGALLVLFDDSDGRPERVVAGDVDLASQKTVES